MHMFCRYSSGHSPILPVVGVTTYYMDTRVGVGLIIMASGAGVGRMSVGAVGWTRADTY